jgi:Holliday junction resolvase-like predicted endonuclease
VARTCRRFGILQQAFRWKRRYEGPRASISRSTKHRIQATAIRFVDEALRQLPVRVEVVNR